jgi:hypothetical protein
MTEQDGGCRLDGRTQHGTARNNCLCLTGSYLMKLKFECGLAALEMIRVSCTCGWNHGAIQHAAIVTHDRRRRNAIVGQ